LALWKAVQHAKLRGLSLRAIARELGIACNTVRRYARTLTPPANRPRNAPEESTREYLTQLTDWHFPGHLSLT
jgi:transcriptional regulator with XRE-family HTH domain